MSKRHFLFLQMLPMAMWQTCHLPRRFSHAGIQSPSPFLPRPPYTPQAPERKRPEAQHSVQTHTVRHALALSTSFTFCCVHPPSHMTFPCLGLLALHHLRAFACAVPNPYLESHCCHLFPRLATLAVALSLSTTSPTSNAAFWHPFFPSTIEPVFTWELAV